MMTPDPCRCPASRVHVAARIGHADRHHPPCLRLRDPKRSGRHQRLRRGGQGAPFAVRGTGHSFHGRGTRSKWTRKIPGL